MFNFAKSRIQIGIREILLESNPTVVRDSVRLSTDRKLGWLPVWKLRTYGGRFSITGEYRDREYWVNSNQFKNTDIKTCAILSMIRRQRI